MEWNEIKTTFHCLGILRKEQIFYSIIWKGDGMERIIPFLLGRFFFKELLGRIKIVKSSSSLFLLDFYTF
jgi:hypothetical protein